MGVLLALLVVAAPVVSPVALAAETASATDDRVSPDGRDDGLPDRWSATVGGGDDDKLATGVPVDGGYLVVGWSNSSTDEAAHDGYVAKLDRTGETEWERTYGDSGTDRLYDVEKVDDGYLVAGMATDDAGTWDGWLLKLGEDGETEWERTYGEDVPGAFWSLARADDRIYVGGWQEDGSTADGWAMELDSDGDPAWSETYDTPYSGADEYVNSAFATDDGDLLMTGSVVGSSSDPSDAWVLKVGDGGEREWDEIYGGGRYDRIHDAVAAGNGDYVLAGQTASDGAGEEDGWMLKIGEDGTQQWDRTFGTPRGDAFFGIHDDPDGGYVVSGAKHVLGENGADGWVVKTDDAGHQQWADTYGEEYWDKFWPVVEGHGGGYLAIGESTSFGDSRDGYLVRIGGPEVAAIQDADENESVRRLAFDDSRLRAVALTESNVSGVVSVAERVDLAALSPPGEPVYAVTVNASDARMNGSAATTNGSLSAANATAAVEFEVQTNEVDANLSDLRVARHVKDGWSVLETAVVSQNNSTAILSADTVLGSTFVVTDVPAPEASIDASEVVTVGESVELSAAGSTAENGTLTAYEWSVGEESRSGRTASVSFAEPGERTVELTVVDENGLRDGAATTLLVNDRPEVEVDAPDEVTVGSAGSFSADVSDDVGNVTVTWAFGDSEVTGESVEHSFGSPGTQTVTVLVEDEYGASATAEVEVDVRAQGEGTEGTTEQTTADTVTETPDSTGGIPGFGVGAAVVALLATVLLARGRP
ncbi:PKD domain-containing protein [Halorussus litoreus]|uniref:PKD domain-containing protein n=1 Tax=Halorussus litoreus TaxID=1710536 RepID=UPI0018E563B8|nr:PKD domain-containing protein [Halorussus litoreus]